MPGIITSINETYYNFGDIRAAGVDYQINYTYRTRVGDFAPSLSVAQTYRYSIALTPGSVPVDAVSQANENVGTFWAPRWKGAAAMVWKKGAYTATIDGRYVGKYQDYDSTREIGNFWFCDASFRFDVGSTVTPTNRWLQHLYLEL